MKQLNYYIVEKLKINKDSNNKSEYHYHPEKLSELIKLLIKLVNKRGSDADLNDVDVSRITDMSDLFHRVNHLSKYKIQFIDISKWDVSNVEDFESMFERCSNFTSDLLRWDFSSAKNVKFMFLNCSKFNSEVGKWKFNPELTNMLRMFDGCESFEGDELDQ